MLSQKLRERLKGHPERIGIAALLAFLIFLIVAQFLRRALDQTAPHNYEIVSVRAGAWPLNMLGYQFRGGPGMWKIRNTSGVRLQVDFGKVHIARGYLAQSCRTHPGDPEGWKWVPHTHHRTAHTVVGQCHLVLSLASAS